jgi:hypothetical protein
MKRWLPHIGIAVGLLIAVYALFFSESDEDRIRGRLEQLEDAVAVTAGDTNLVLRAARVNAEFAEIFVKDVGFEIPELSSAAGGRAELVGLAANAPQLYATASVDLGGLAIEIDDQGMTAVAFGEATVRGTRHSGDPEGDSRTVSLRFDQIDGEWQVVSLSVSPPRQQGPESP